MVRLIELLAKFYSLLQAVSDNSGNVLHADGSTWIYWDSLYQWPFNLVLFSLCNGYKKEVF